jgi:hypothetical protein
VGRLTRTPRLVVCRKSLELRILNDRGNIGSIDQPQADRRARPLRRRAEMMARPARVRIRRRKPWVRLRRRLLGWNVRLLTEELPHLRSARQIRYGADTTRIAGASRWQRPLCKRPSNGTGRRQTGQTDVDRGRRRVGRLTWGDRSDLSGQRRFGKRILRPCPADTPYGMANIADSLAHRVLGC